MLSKSTATQLLIIKKGKSKHVNKHPVITYSINEKKKTSVQKLNISVVHIMGFTPCSHNATWLHLGTQIPL